MPLYRRNCVCVFLMFNFICVVFIFLLPVHLYMDFTYYVLLTSVGYLLLWRTSLSQLQQLCRRAPRACIHIIIRGFSFRKYISACIRGNKTACRITNRPYSRKQVYTDMYWLNSVRWRNDCSYLW